MSCSKVVDNGAMLNAYPDSIGGTLTDIVAFLKNPVVENAFCSFYILPSIFNTDLDRGFSVIDYQLNENLATLDNLTVLKENGYDLKLDFILNHASVLSPQFQDILKNGQSSKYKDFFIPWNEFWQGNGNMAEEGYIQPNEALIKNMFFRKSGLPILMVRMPDGEKVPYWNTFYQEVRYPTIDPQDLMSVTTMQYNTAEKLAKTINLALQEGKKPKDIAFGDLQIYKQDIVELLEKQCKYLGQIDLNIKSALVWEYYEHILKTLSEYGAKIVRLDAFAYAPKSVGSHNFLNEPDTWDLLTKVRSLADKYNVVLLPEIHASYAEKTYQKIADAGYMTYDFFLPGLVIDALERGQGDKLACWAEELQAKKIRVVNMLGCHDGIPLLDLKGLLPDDQIQNLIDIVVKRGGYVKNLHGQKNVYYQVNATYYSALGEDDEKMLLARAIQLFMPGKPQVWYLDLFCGVNDHDAVKLAGEGGHKEINRTSIPSALLQEKLQNPITQTQIKMLQFRNTFAAFGFDSTMNFTHNGGVLTIQWEKNNCTAKLQADLRKKSFTMVGYEKEICMFSL